MTICGLYTGFVFVFRGNKFPRSVDQMTKQCDLIYASISVASIPKLNLRAMPTHFHHIYTIQGTGRYHFALRYVIDQYVYGWRVGTRGTPVCTPDTIPSIHAYEKEGKPKKALCLPL